MLQKFRTYQLALDFHKECQKLPTKGEIKDQLSRASLSIVLNTAEGAGRVGAKDKKHFYSIALGSLRETEAILDITESLHLKALANQIGACLYVLSRK